MPAEKCPGPLGVSVDSETPLYRLVMGNQREMTLHITSAAMVLACVLGTSAPAHAHIKLLQPASFLQEDELGGPQKGSPCGPGNTRPFIGDDIQPTPYSDVVTTFHAGESITVEWEETIYHPGYFRIAFAPVAARSATSEDFPDPSLSDPEACLFDRSAVSTEPHGHVLADGLYMAEAQDGEVRHFTQEVTLPDEPCEECSLQIVQIMEAHPAASCFYFHCADIQIVPKQGADAGADTGDGGAASADAAAQTEHAASEGGGCAVAQVGVRAGRSELWLVGLALAGCLRLCRGRWRPRP